MRILIFIALLCAAVQGRGQIYIDSYRFAAGSDTLILDLYPDASVAFSLRKVRTAYTGNCITVRRASNNDTTNIGFVNNYLDTATLKTFCSGTSCFVVTWFDQSGNNINARQATHGEQPRIVNGGNLEFQQGKATLFFDGIDYLNLGNVALYNNTNGQTAIGVYKIETSQINKGIITKYKAIDNKRQWLLSSDNYNVQENLSPFTANNVSTGLNAAGFYLGMGIWRPGISNIFYQNNNTYTAITATNTVETSSENTLIGTSGDSNTTITGYIFEIIVYEAEKSSIRAAMQTALNTYYVIY